uniref:Uncharacterized protein n=1 Tax=Chlamydomonas euryale TaxID=1486919 RepID=A0A7R9V971_9CHLO|mmetsp:Transcript_27000/g.80054  ORF Transcript_27000/g.80054 Transcript_27000/m.80054 type:complete len:272 (+) Transcript_27000:218-1033(+)
MDAVRAGGQKASGSCEVQSSSYDGEPSCLQSQLLFPRLWAQQRQSRNNVHSGNIGSSDRKGTGSGDGASQRRLRTVALLPTLTAVSLCAQAVIALSWLSKSSGAGAFVLAVSAAALAACALAFVFCWPAHFGVREYVALSPLSGAIMRAGLPNGLPALALLLGLWTPSEPSVYAPMSKVMCIAPAFVSTVINVLIVKLAASVEEQRKLLWHNLFNDQLDLLFVVLLWLAVSDQEAPTSTIMTIFMMRLNVGLFVVSLTPYTPAPASLQRAL